MTVLISVPAAIHQNLHENFCMKTTTRSFIFDFLKHTPVIFLLNKLYERLFRTNCILWDLSP